MHLANNIDDDDMKLIPEIFKNIDGDHDGQLNSNELKEFVLKCDQKKAEQVEKLLEEVDLNNNDLIDYREFVAVEAGT